MKVDIGMAATGAETVTESRPPQPPIEPSTTGS